MSKTVWECPECGARYIDDGSDMTGNPLRCVSDDPDHSSGADRIGVLMQPVEQVEDE